VVKVLSPKRLPPMRNPRVNAASLAPSGKRLCLGRAVIQALKASRAPHLNPKRAWNRRTKNYALKRHGKRFVLNPNPS
jgi:hypothetical protein